MEMVSINGDKRQHENTSDVATQLRDMLLHENHQLKSEIIELKRELDELQDTFRIKDAEEFRQMQINLDATNKKCRVMQYRITKLEKTNEELCEAKLYLEDKRTECKADELKDELTVAKEVSIRLHKDLERCEVEGQVVKDLNEKLRTQVDRLCSIMNESDDSDTSKSLSNQLQESMQREYQQSAQISKMRCEIRDLQDQLNEQSQSMQNNIECDQKLVLLHNYVCRLREAVEEKDNVIARLQALSGPSDGEMDDIVDLEGSCRFLDATTLTNCFGKYNGIQPKGGSDWTKFDASTQYDPGSVRMVQSASCDTSDLGYNEQMTNPLPNEVGQLRALIKEYMNVKGQLEGSLKEACEILVCKEQELDDVRDERKKLSLCLKELQADLDARIKHACQMHTEQIEYDIRVENDNLHKTLDTITRELNESRREQFNSNQERLHQLQELRCLENNYRELGERLNNEVCHLNKQITQLNEDKEQLEGHLAKLRANKRPPIGVPSKLIANQSAPLTVGSAKTTSTRRPTQPNRLADRRRRVQNAGINCNGVDIAEQPTGTTSKPKTYEPRTSQPQHNAFSGTERSKIAPTTVVANKSYGSHVGAKKQLAAADTALKSSRLRKTKQSNDKPTQQTRVSNEVTSCPPVDQRPNNSPSSTDSSVTTRGCIVGHSTKCGHGGTCLLKGGNTSSIISNKAQSLISRIRYRSSSTAIASNRRTNEHDGVRKPKDSKLPTPGHSSIVERQVNEGNQSPHVTLPSNMLFNNDSDNSIIRIVETRTEIQQSLNAESASGGGEQIKCLLSKVTSTARPLMMNKDS